MEDSPMLRLSDVVREAGLSDKRTPLDDAVERFDRNGGDPFSKSSGCPVRDMNRLLSRMALDGAERILSRAALPAEDDLPEAARMCEQRAAALVAIAEVEL